MCPVCYVLATLATTNGDFLKFNLCFHLGGFIFTAAVKFPVAIVCPGSLQL